MGKLNIKNREEIIEQLAEMLLQFDKDENNYQTDVYLYYDEEQQTAELDTFVNIGGNSWLDDDHYTIYTDKEHYSGIWDYYQSVEELAEYSGIPLDDLRNKIIASFELDGDEAAEYELDYYDVREYLRQNDKAMEKLTAAYYEALEDLQPEYIYKANEIMDNFDNVCKMYD